jgi:hypothetical protein
MNFGYLLVVSEVDKIDYLNMAYVLAMSIKITQKEGYDKVALVIDDKSRLDRLKSPWVFDQVIEWNEAKGWDGRSHMDLLSPWENTICLDADMIFFRDISHCIDYFVENCELYVPSKVYTYRGEIVTDNFYRKCFEANELPNLYSMFTFFKKTDTSKLFFEINRNIIKDPDSFAECFFMRHIPKVIGTDEAFALSAQILDISDQITYDLQFPKIVHMKTMVQNWSYSAEKFTDHVGFYLSRSGQLKIGNFQQHDIVHYVEKDLITEEYVSIFEELIWKK